MIIGIGNDLVEIARMRRIIEQSTGPRFVERVLTPRESALDGGRNKRKLAEFVAGRFAVKESVVKALGCGIGSLVGFQDIEVLPDPAGKPVCRISPEALSRLEFVEGKVSIHVGITHSKAMAAGVAVVESCD